MDPLKNATRNNAGLWAETLLAKFLDEVMPLVIIALAGKSILLGDFLEKKKPKIKLEKTYWELSTGSAALPPAAGASPGRRAEHGLRPCPGLAELEPAF